MADSARPTRRRWSIATRLTAWYAATSFVLVTAVVGSQYRALSRDLASEDDQLLVETLAAALRGLRGAPPTEGSAAEGPFVRVLDAACRPEAGPWPATLPPPACASESGAPTFRDWRAPSGEPWRMLAVRDTTLGRTIEILLSRRTDDQVLARNRSQLFGALPLALLLSLGLGYVGAQRGLRPLSQLAARVRAVDARSLDRRLRLDDAPEEIEALSASFDEMLARLEGAFAALTNYSAEMAHEIRAPLHAMRQQLEVALARARTTDEYRDVLGSSLEELEWLGRMAGDMLFLARAEDPRAVVSCDELRAVEELDSVAEFMEGAAAERGIVLSTEAAAVIVLRADRTLVRRALVNLVANALEHTPAGGRVTLRAAMGADGVTLFVDDTGHGLAPADVERAFDRYFRGGGGSRPGGAGLGLAIVRGIMRLHGGTASLASDRGRGTTATLHFPSGADREKSDGTVI